MKKMTAEAGSSVDIADGTYQVEVSKIEETELDGSRFGAGTRPGAKFYFTLPEMPGPDGEPIELTAVATAEKLTPKTKLWAWIEALTGVPVQTGQSIDLDALVGCHALAAVANETGEDGVVWARIKSLLALPKQAEPAKAVHPVPVTELRDCLKACREHIWKDTAQELAWFQANCPHALAERGEQVGVSFASLTTTEAVILLGRLKGLLQLAPESPQDEEPPWE